MSRARTPVDAGYTMIEMIVTIALAGTLMAIAVSGWQGWSRASAHDGLATELQLVMRQAQQRAVTTGTSTCVDFDDATDSWLVLVGACGTPSPTVTDRGQADDDLDIGDVDFEGEDSVTFSPRGTADEGTLSITRLGGGRTVTIHVERLTGRVSVD